MADGKNDIVINATAQTKDAEKNIAALDARIQTMSQKAPGIDKASKAMKDVGTAAKKAGDDAKAIGAGFSALQGSLTGVITKLGAAGLAIGVLLKLQTALRDAQKDYANSLSAIGKAEEAAVNARASRAKEALDTLSELNSRAKDSPLDPEAIKLENNLVKQLSDTWGDVGISVNQTTGEVEGLLQATEKIAGQIRGQKLSSLSKQIQAARLDVQTARDTYNDEYDEYGNQRVSLAGIGNNLKATGEGILSFFSGEGFDAGYNQRVTTRENEYKAAITEAESKLEELQAQQKELQLNATKEDAARILKQADETRQAEKTIFQNDAREQALIRALANAQMTGGDVTGAKAALDDYIQQRNAARYSELSNMASQDEKDIDKAQKDYVWALQNGSGADIAEAAKALARVTDIAKQHTDEMAKIAAGQYKPADAAQTVLARTTAMGTFNAFGIGGLMSQNIEQEQLQVQKEIAANTKQLARPVVSE